MRDPSSLRTRREFMGNCAVLTASAVMPQFLLHTANSVAAENGWEAGSAAPLPGFADGRSLVVVQLSGGNDGLNTVIPYVDDAYHRARPRLAVPASKQIPLNDTVALHESLLPLRKLYDQGLVSIVEGVGYPNPDRSHFRSMEIWHTGSDSDKFSPTGWIGRYFDNHCEGEPKPTAGLFVGAELPQAFDGESRAGLAFQSPERFGFVEGFGADDKKAFREINRNVGAGSNESLDFLRTITETANASADQVHEISRRIKNDVDFPKTSFGRGLATISKMMRGDLGTRIYYISLKGFDTHANQAGPQARLLGEYAEGMLAFTKDLQRAGLSDRVTTLTFSEFGRRVEQNASGGTDHGTAAPMFMIGDAVQGGIYGERPSLNDLDANGDLKFTTDFRSVYASVLEQWMEVDPKIVLGRSFETLPLISA